MTCRLHNGSYHLHPKGRHTQATKSLVSSKLHVTGCLCWGMYRKWVESHAQHMLFTHNRDLAELSCPHGRLENWRAPPREVALGGKGSTIGGEGHVWGSCKIHVKLGGRMHNPFQLSVPACCAVCLLPPLTGIPHLAFATRPAGLPKLGL